MYIIAVRHTYICMYMYTKTQFFFCFFHISIYTKKTAPRLAHPMIVSVPANATLQDEQCLYLLLQPALGGMYEGNKKKCMKKTKKNV